MTETPTKELWMNRDDLTVLVAALQDCRRSRELWDALEIPLNTERLHDLVVIMQTTRDDFTGTGAVAMWFAHTDLELCVFAVWALYQKVSRLIDPLYEQHPANVVLVSVKSRCEVLHGWLTHALTRENSVDGEEKSSDSEEEAARGNRRDCV